MYRISTTRNVSIITVAMETEGDIMPSNLQATTKSYTIQNMHGDKRDEYL